ncbi:MAG: hypothetical protein V2A54_09420 [Bacteroidota bacterium]
MKKHFLLLSILVVSTTLHAQIPDIPNLNTDPSIIKKYPTLEKAVAHFYKNYGVDDNNVIEISRRPEGWFVAKKVWENNNLTIQKTEKFWDLKSGEFVTIKDFSEALPNFLKKDSYLRGLSMEDWNHCVYYGYDEWDIDMIKAFGQNSKLSDTVLYGLARAYSNFALGFIRGQYGFRSQKTKVLGYEKASEEQLNNFLLFENKCIESLHKIYQRNPSFPTLIGTIQNKWANEQMNAWMVLISIHEEEKAKGWLHENFYNGFMIATAKNQLNVCKQDGILFTNGDNDTFPLWYVQEMMSYRKDVTVLNLSLLNAGWYVDMMVNRTSYAKKIPLSLTKNQYDDNGIDIIYIAEKTAPAQNLKEIFVQFKDTPSAFRMAGFGSDSVWSFPTATYFLDINPREIIRNGVVPESWKNDIQEKMEWKVKKSYLFKSDLIALNLMATCDFQRPLYFCSTVSSGSFLGLEDYFKNDGLVYQLIPAKNSEKNSSSYGRMDTDACYDNLMNKLEWSAPENANDENSFDNRMSSTYRWTFSQLAESLLAAGKKDSARKVVDRAMELMPEKDVPYDQFLLFLAKSYYRTGDIEKADKIYFHLLEIYDGFLNSVTGTRDMKKYRDEIRTSLAVLQEITRVTDVNNRTVLHSKANAAFEKHAATFPDIID